MGTPELDLDRRADETGTVKPPQPALPRLSEAAAAAAAERRAREAAALRENLRRRKQQLRSRTPAPPLPADKP